MLSIKPTILIVCIFTGYLIGVSVYFFDNTPYKASFGYNFSHFNTVFDTSSVLKKYKEPTALLSQKDKSSQLWFFREQPLFLLWAIMHVIGVSLCLACCVLNYNIQKSIRTVYRIPVRKSINAFAVVLISLGVIVWASYSRAYGFDYVAYLIPLNHSSIKIYSLESINYLTGAYSLINMMLITSVVKQNASEINNEEFTRLQKCFNLSLFIAATVIAYATLASGVLYKALNNFYYEFYDPNHKSTPYFPVIIIITLGLINTFLLSMFYFPNVQVFKEFKKLYSKNLILSVSINDESKNARSFWGISNDILETVKVLLAILAPLLSGLFS